jgi:S-formylglutathione hydrolase FrmB
MTYSIKKALLILAFLVILFSGLRAQNQHILNSKHISKADTVWVFTPSEYKSNPAKAYPLIYLLHGWSGNYHQWNDIMDCQEYANRYGFIIVCPDGLYDSWYINSPAIQQSQYTDFFFKDLMPFVSKNYRTESKNMFITGLSMGGYGALYLFEQKPELFRSAGSLSGLLDLTTYWNIYEINQVLGINDQKSGENLLNAYSVIGNAGKIAHSEKEIIFTCGTSDPFYAINNDFRLKCDELKIKATYITSPGTHNYEYWKSVIGFHFYFFKKMMKADE